MARKAPTKNTTSDATPKAPRTRKPASGGTTAGSTSLPAAPKLDGAATKSPRTPTPEEIRRRAFEIYLARGGRGGDPDADWLQAERELRTGR